MNCSNSPAQACFWLLGKGTPSVRNAGRRIQECTTGAWLQSSFSLLSNCLAADRREKGERLGYYDLRSLAQENDQQQEIRTSVNQSHIPMALQGFTVPLPWI